MKRLSLAFLALCATAAWGDTPIYKWVDPQGVTHYSTVPHSTTAQAISIANHGTLPNSTTAPAAATTPAPAAGTGAGLSSDDLALTTPTPGDSTACKMGRERLSKYLHADTLYSEDAQGKRQTLSDTDRQKALDDARSYVKQNCGSGGS